MVLNSLQKYQPLLHITEHTEEACDHETIKIEPNITVVFPETVFMAVTAYQSEKVRLIVQR